MTPGYKTATRIRVESGGLTVWLRVVTGRIQVYGVADAKVNPNPPSLPNMRTDVIGYPGDRTAAEQWSGRSALSTIKFRFGVQ